jgi:hypothetical protein
VNVLLKIAGLVGRCAYQIRGRVLGSDPGHVGIDFGFELGIGKELDQLGAADFSLPLAQRALQAVTMIGHDFMYLGQDFWGSVGRRIEGQPIGD